MKKEKNDQVLGQGERRMNSMFTNIQNMAKEKDDRYDADFLYFCIRGLNERYGQTMRYIMCKLIESGLASHEVYSRDLKSLRCEFERLAGKGRVKEEREVVGPVGAV